MGKSWSGVSNTQPRGRNWPIQAIYLACEQLVVREGKQEVAVGEQVTKCVWLKLSKRRKEIGRVNAMRLR